MPSDPPRSSPPRSRPSPVDWAVALGAVAAIALHDAAHVAAGRYWDVFWVCNVAAAVVGPAIVLRSGALAGAALTWLLPGTVVWLLDAVVAGSNILPTSYAVHLGGTLAAVYGVKRCGRARRVAVTALALLLVALAVSRTLLPAAANVNAAHAIPRGWGFLGRSRAAFAASSAGLVAVTLLLGAALSRWLTRAAPGD